MAVVDQTKVEVILNLTISLQVEADALGLRSFVLGQRVACAYAYARGIMDSAGVGFKMRAVGIVLDLLREDDADLTSAEVDTAAEVEKSRVLNERIAARLGISPADLD